MKLKIVAALLLIAAAWYVGRRHFAGAEVMPVGLEGGVQEINDSYRLEKGAIVEVSGINGPVQIEAVDGDAAEIHVVNSVSSAEDLAHHHITVEKSPSRLVIRGEGRQDWHFWRWLFGRGERKQSVTLRLPREVELTTRGVNGRVEIGRMEGPVRVSDVNGRVEVGRAKGQAEVSGVNGAVGVGVSELKDGIRINGVNGKVELRLAEGVNADLTVNGLNGKVNFDVPNATVEEQESRSRLRARIGAGGPAVEIRGVNGKVNISRL